MSMPLSMAIAQTPAPAMLHGYAPTLSVHTPLSVAPLGAASQPPLSTATLRRTQGIVPLPAGPQLSGADTARSKVTPDLRSRKTLAMKQHLALGVSKARSPVDGHIQRRRTGMTAVPPKRHAALPRSKRPASSSHFESTHAAQAQISPRRFERDGQVDDVSALLANFTC